MTFGIEVKNPKGSVMFNEREETYLYLGKAPFNHTGGSSTEILPFRIPSNVPFLAFVYGRDDGSSPILIERDKLVCFFEPAETNYNYSADVYLFVPARCIPTPSWGVAVYKPNGTVTYHSGRPMLQIDSFASLSLDGAKQDATAYSVYEAPKKVASALTFLGATFTLESEPNGVGGNKLVAYENYLVANAYRHISGRFRVGVDNKKWPLPATNWYWSPSVPVKTYSIPLIDCAFYDQFSNYAGNLS